MLSVFTPSHNPRWLNECYESLCAQSHDDWEWVVVLNGGAQWALPRADERVRIYETNHLKGVGALKAYACSLARGDVLVELDHDDLLRTDALELVDDAFSCDLAVGLVYSDFAQITAEAHADGTQFDARHGWFYYDAEVNGIEVRAAHAMPPFPSNFGYVWYCANHLRAFRRSVYERVGGHDAELAILDDHDLCCRMFAEADCLHIPECLYLQRVHSGNTQSESETNARIQAETVVLYDRYIRLLALSWAHRHGLDTINLAVGDVPTGPVGVVLVDDCLHLLGDPVRLFAQLHEYMVHGAMIFIRVPSTDGRGAFMDPRTERFYNEMSFQMPFITDHFMTSRLVTYFPNDFHREHQIPYVACDLVCIKDGPRLGGILLSANTRS